MKNSLDKTQALPKTTFAFERGSSVTRRVAYSLALPCDFTYNTAFSEPNRTIGENY
jgi:hypothetical protein